MIDKQTYITLGNLLLDNLKGKLHLHITEDEKASLSEASLQSIIRQEENRTYNQIYQDKDKRKEFFKKFFSYDEIDEFINDYQVEDIAINGRGPIYIHTTQRGLVKTDKRFSDVNYFNFFLKKLMVFAGRTSLGKINDFELPRIEGRVNIVHSPFGHQITITRIKRMPLSITQLIEKNTLDYKTASFLWLAVEGMGLRPANMLIVGGTGAGKTTLLNALLGFIPQNERVIIIEDTLELNTQCSCMDNHSRLESDTQLSLEDLVKNTLRMRPERIIVGEVRGREAQDMMTAMNIGKYCMCTIHASNTKEAFARLENAPMNVPESLLNLIDVIVVLRKFRKKEGVFRIIEEISETSFREQKRPLISVLWRHNYEKDAIEEGAPFTILRDKLSESTGKPPLAILEEWDLRAKVIAVLHEKEIYTFEKVTDFFSSFNLDRTRALESIDTTLEDIKKMPSKIT